MVLSASRKINKCGWSGLTTYLPVNQKNKIMNKRLLFIRLTIVSVIIFNFIISFRLENEVACLIMFFNFLLALGYLAVEIMIARD